MKIALITGITGQDGYYLSRFLLNENYIVHGIVRRSSNFNTQRIDNLISEYGPEKKLILHYADLTDSSSIHALVSKILPDEIYNLGAQSHVAVSFLNPGYTADVSISGTTALLESIKNSPKKIKFYQASSSEMFGGKENTLLDETSLLDPKSPYAAAKVFSHNLTKIYRDSYGIFGVNGILFNHESPLRGETFVTRKISRAVGRIKNNLQSKLTLGNIHAFRDWGFAGDYVKGMYMMMQHETPDDFVLSTGETHSVKEFSELAFAHVGLDWKEFVITDKRYERPNEVHHLLGNSEKAKKILKWEPETSFEKLVQIMVEADVKKAEQEKLLISEGLLSPTWEHPIGL